MALTTSIQHVRVRYSNVRTAQKQLTISCDSKANILVLRDPIGTEVDKVSNLLLFMDQMNTNCCLELRPQDTQSMNRLGTHRLCNINLSRRLPYLGLSSTTTRINKTTVAPWPKHLSRNKHTPRYKIATQPPQDQCTHILTTNYALSIHNTRNKHLLSKWRFPKHEDGE